MRKIDTDNSLYRVKSEQNDDLRQNLWPTYAPPKDLIFTHGKGAKLYSDTGRQYLDFLSGIAVNSFGHSHPELISTLEDSANGIWHLSNVFRIPEAEQLASRITSHCFGRRVFFTNSGTESVEAGIKAMRGHQYAQGHKERYRVISLTGSFHGRTIGALGAAANPAHCDGFIPFDYGFDQAEWGDIESLKQQIGDQTAGVILEPIRGEGGIKVLDQQYLEQVRALCDEHGLLLMYDEVQCGVGRTGKLFAYQHSGVAPDVMALAKGIGAGFPLGACVVTEEVGSSMTIGKHGSTFGGNPIAAKIGSKVFDLLLEPGFLKTVEHKGYMLIDQLKKLVGKYPDLINSVSGRGLMIGIDCEVPNTELLAAFRDNGLIVGKSGANMLRLLPPLNVTLEDIHEAIAIMERTLSDIQAK